MARRHPSSVLSICMSLIFDTSSVSTLWENKKKKRHARTKIKDETHSESLCVNPELLLSRLEENT